MAVGCVLVSQKIQSVGFKPVWLALVVTLGVIAAGKRARRQAMTPSA
jgi:hypothetical protein